MRLPAYPGSTWTPADLTNDENFSNLNNWNYGFADDNSSGPNGGYYPWYATGSSPYWGSSMGSTGDLDYDLPGNVSQTSTGYNSSLFSGYAPQTFNPNGWGVSFTAHYTGPRTWNTVNGARSATWTSGVINSYNKIFFPSGGKTQAFVQVKAEMMSYGGKCNGAWDALWFLGQGNEQREIDLQETGICGASTNLICSHLQSPQVFIEGYASSSDLAAGYHIYAMELVNGVVNIYLDNVLVGTATSSTPGPYFLLMNGAISDGTWSPAPSQNVDMTMNVMEVQVYQR
jgi:hypothetical protein